MASLIYDSCIHDALTGAIDFDTDSFKAMVVTSAYVADKGAHLKRSDITNEASGTGYTAGGEAVAVSVSKDTVNHRVDVNIGDVSIPNATLTGRALVVYKSRGGLASADELVAYVDAGSDISSTNGTWSFDITSPLRIQN